MDVFAKGGERTVRRESLRIEGIEGKEQTNLTSNPGTGGRAGEGDLRTVLKKALKDLCQGARPPRPGVPLVR